MQRLERRVDIWLFECKAHARVLIIVAHAKNLRTCANLVIHIKNIVDAVIFRIDWIVIFICF